MQGTASPPVTFATFTCGRGLRGPARRAVATVQDDIVEHIEEQPDDPGGQHQQRRLRLLGADVPLDGLHQDAEHERHGEDGVAKGPHHVGPQEAEGALPVARDAAGPQAEQAYDHGQEVREDGEGVRGQGQGVADVGDRQLHDEQEDAHHAHEDQAEGSPRVSAHGSGRQAGCALFLSGQGSSYRS